MRMRVTLTEQEFLTGPESRPLGLENDPLPRRSFQQSVDSCSASRNLTLI